MSTSVQQIIEAAYSRSAANDAGKIADESELIPVLNRIFQALFAMAAAAAPDRYVSRTTLPLSGSPASGTLAADVIDIRRVQTASGAKVHVILVEEIDKAWHVAPAVYRQGGVLVSRGKAGDPLPSDTLTLWQLDAPATLTALADSLDARFPVRHVDLIIDELALYLSTKDEGRNVAEFQKLTASRDAKMEVFMRLSGLSLTALSSPHGGALIQRVQQAIAGPGGGG